MEIPDSLVTLFAVLSFVLGAMVGSFLNVVVYRLPKNESIVKPRSKCPKCGNPIAWYDNMPILSWLLLGAKCRRCGQPISWQYPLVEAITGALFFLVFWRFGFTIATPIYMVLAGSMVLVTFVDLTDWTIPNEVTMPGIPIGIVLAVVGMMYPESGLQLDDPLMALIGIFVGGGIVYGLDQLSLLLLKKRGMGFGDVKLMAMLGAFFGPWGAVLTLVIASFIGSAVGLPLVLISRKEEQKAEKGSGHYLPFGPYIAVGGLVVMFFGPDIIEAYINYLRVPGPIEGTL